YGGYKIYDSILQDDDGSQEWLGTTMLSIGVVSGLTFGLWGFYEALSATPLGAYAGRKSAGYKEADAKQKALGKRVSWHISPKYDLYNQATLISLNVTFRGATQCLYNYIYLESRPRKVWISCCKSRIRLSRFSTISSPSILSCRS